MNKVRFLIVGMLMIALFAGAAMYYLQVYAFYDEVDGAEFGDVQLVSLHSGTPEPILFENFNAIDASSSPIRFRACFETTQSLAMLTETYLVYDSPEPLTGPNWFDCYDAQEVGAALETGEAVAFLAQENVEYGVDRVAAILSDGRGFLWHQINACGMAVFDGEPAPETCPEPPEGY